MTVSVSTDLIILKSLNPNVNKCPLKVSLVGIPQELPRVLENDENAIFNVLISDYTGQDVKFVIKIVFQHLNSRFAHLKNTIRPQDSLIFVVGQMEIIDNDFYVYAKDINFVNTQFSSKQKSLDNSLYNSSSTAVNATRSKLIATHRNVVES